MSFINTFVKLIVVVAIFSTIYFKGLVNDVDLADLQMRYMSLSTRQKVSTPLRFHGHVHFRNSVTVDTLSLQGLVKVPQR